MNSRTVQALPIVVMLAFASLGATILGGWDDSDPEDPAFKEAVSEAFQSLKSYLRTNNVATLGPISNVYSQVVNGMKYKADITVQFKECEASRCPVIKTQNCTVVIWHRVTENVYELSSHTCQKPVFQPLQANRMMGGTFQVEDLNSESLKAVAQFALKHLQSVTDTPVELTFGRILNATTQVVAGTNYRLVVEFNAKNKLEPENEHMVVCYFLVFKDLSGGKGVTRHDCDDEMFIQ